MLPQRPRAPRRHSKRSTSLSGRPFLFLVGDEREQTDDPLTSHTSRPKSIFAFSIQRLSNCHTRLVETRTPSGKNSLDAYASVIDAVFALASSAKWRISASSVSGFTGAPNS